MVVAVEEVVVIEAPKPAVVEATAVPAAVAAAPAEAAATEGVPPHWPPLPAVTQYQMVHATALPCGWLVLGHMLWCLLSGALGGDKLLQKDCHASTRQPRV